MHTEPAVRELHDIVTSLLESDDGSCRDINFEAPTWTGVGTAMASLETAFGEVSGTDQDGAPLSPLIREGALTRARKGGHAHLLFGRGGGIMKNLQLFLCSEDDGSPFIELTFFPEDVRPSPSLRDDFIAWVKQLQSWLGARRCYARYENASWRFGDIGPQSGVFMVSDEVEQDA